MRRATEPGTARIDGIASGELYRRFAEVERLDPIAGEIELAKLMVETNFRSITLEIGQRRIDEGGAESLLRDQRTAGAAAARQRLAHDGPGKRRRCLGGIGVECGEKDRTHEPFV